MRDGRFSTRLLMALAVALALGVAAGAFAVGRATAPDEDVAPSRPANGRVLTGRFGDELDVPSAQVYCRVTGEAGVENLLICQHAGEDPTYQVVFDPESTIVYRIGGDGPVFSGKEE